MKTGGAKGETGRVTMNILYVEDDLRDADLARRELARSAPDLRLDVVATLQEALAHLEGEPAYDLLLTDLRLPDGDGLSLLAHVRERALPLAVVVVTGRGDEETVVAALRAGADDYVVKRADYLAHLPKVLADALNRYRVQAERRARPLRVLYAEPNASDADLTRRHLARYAPHIHLKVVSTGRQALRRLADTPAPAQEMACDLLLLDYRLPGMDALEILKEVRQVRGLDLPVVLVSGRGKPEVALQAFNLGAADYLPKNPGYLFRLPAVLENAFHRAQLAREQAALRASEAQYRTLFEGVPIGLYRTTPAGQILDANPALVHMLGYPDRESLLAAEVTGVYVNPQDRQRWQALLEREGVVTDFEAQLCRGDGATIWVRDNARAVRDAEGRAVYYEGSLEDVTERKQVEEALAEERNLLRTLIDNMPDYIFVKDTESRFVTTNTAHLRTLGVETVEEVVGKTDLSFFPQELAEQYYADEQAVVSSGQPLLNRVEKAIDPEGGEQWLLTTKVPLRDSSGSIVGLVGMSRDISELKGAEKVLERQNVRLQALYRAGQLLNSSLEIDTVLDHLVDEAMRITRASHGQVLVARQESNCFERHSLRGFSPQKAELARTVPLLLEEGLNGQAYRTGQAACVDDVRANPDYFPLIPSTHAELVVPIVREGQVLGNLDLQSPEVGAFRDVDLKYLNALADQAAIALENARLFQKTQQQLQELGLLFEVSVTLATGLEPDDVLQATARQITAALAVEGCAISSWDRDRDTLVTLLDYSPEPNAWKPEPPGTLYALAGYPASRRVVTGRQPTIVQVTDPEADPAEVAWMTAQGVKSLLMAPLVARNQAIGLVELMECDEPRTFTPAETRLAQTLSNLAAAALENARLFDETRRRNRELALLNRVIAASASSQEIEPILETVCRELALAFGIPQSAAALLNAERTEAVVVAEYLAQGRTSALGEVIPVEGNPSFQHMLEHRAPLVVDNTQTDPRLASIHDIERRRGTVSLLILPLIVEGEVVGSLGVDAIEPRLFSAEEVDLARRVAEQVSGALARARLEETQRRLSTAVEQAAEAVIITDTVGVVLYANPAFEQSSGYSCAEVIGQHLSLLRSSNHDATFYHDMWQTLASGRVWQGRMINQKRDGNLYTADATISPLRNQAREIVNYVATMRDVTREVELEEQFRQAQKMEAVGRLAGGVAHDFNNLLTIIHLSTRLLEKKLHRQDPLWEHVQRIQDAGRRATDLTKQLLAFSRREIVEPQVLNLNEVLGELDKMLRRLIGEDVELTLRPAEELWPVKIDPTQVEQVVINLAVNARDAMPSGGSLTLETANVMLDTAYAARHLDVEPGEYVLLAVSDTGAGMSNEVKARLFEPFFTTKERGKGTGLGLATVFGIVKQNRGHIWVYSEAGQGTTFKVYLPRAAEGALALSRLPTVSVEPSARGSETLLVVEDESDVRDLVRDILAAWGYRILAARDGVEALEVAQSHEGSIHLLITDVVMPRLSGKALADQLRASRPGLRVLFTSGYTDNAIVQHGVLAEGVHFLSKPFELEALARKVREVLGGSI
jgi:PAS domain S-box-containing protein